MAVTFRYSDSERVAMRLECKRVSLRGKATLVKLALLRLRAKQAQSSIQQAQVQ